MMGAGATGCEGPIRGPSIRIDRLLVDMGYKPGIVAAVKHKSGGQTMMLAKGVGIRTGSKPVAMYQKRPGWRLGCNWFIPSVRGTAEFPHVVNDVNWWKSFVHDRLLVAVGDPGSLTLYGGKDTNHAMFSEHVAGSEYYVMTSGHGRDVKEWKWRPERPDNHWFDCLVGCAAAASLDGLAVPGTISVRRQAAVRPASQRVAYL
jgi:hypothetical protein